MTTGTNDFFMIQNRQAAYENLEKVSQESEFTSLHKGFTKVPHKIHRCYGLSQYEKLILCAHATALELLKPKLQHFAATPPSRIDEWRTGAEATNSLLPQGNRDAVLYGHTKRNAYLDVPGTYIR